VRLGPWIEGGAERQDSVRQGLAALAKDREGPPDWVLVHDGARPLCSRALLQRVLAALEHHSAVVPAVHPIDTVRGSEAAPSGPQFERSAGVQPRDTLRLSQTPQAFHWHTLHDAHAAGEGLAATDDAQLVERTGGQVMLVPGERRNFKVTLPDDLALAEWALQHPEWGLSS
jgi:2-C-methyl-D-erythritol 4-phosphate cytidylyltransferase